MTFTNTQTTELSLDQLDDISAGWIGVAIKGAAKLGKFARASNGIRSGLRTGLKNVVSRSVPYVKPAKQGALRGFFGGLAAAIFFANPSGQGHNGQSPSQG